MASSFLSLICSDKFLNNRTLSISNDGNVFSVGYSKFNAHGHETLKIFPFTKINNLTNIKMIDCGESHSIFLNYDGDIFSLGSNYYGQLGIGKHDNEFKQTHIPQKINLSPCKQISCGNNFTICKTEDNRLYSFGANYDGQLGLRNTKNYSSPQLIPNFNNIEYIVCGESHSICKTYNNEFYSWGDNRFGKLGQGNNNRSCNKPIQCFNWPDNIISIKCSLCHSLLLTSEGQVYSFGKNDYGQLGIKKKSINKPKVIKDIPEIQRIECRPDHSLFIDINNNLWLLGGNGYGQLGLGDTYHKYKPIQHPTLLNIIDISSKGKHTFVKTIDNKIYAFGLNNNAQIGIKTLDNFQLTPIQVLEGKEDIWCSTIGKSRAKSARK